MKLPRRKFLHLAAGASAALGTSRLAWAQPYPTRPVHLVVGYAAGGPTDITARLVGQWLSERLGQQFVIENRPGAASNVGTAAVVRAPNDGYTLGLFGTTNAINATLYDKLNYNFIRDIAPVAGIMRTTNVVVVNPSSPAKTIAEFVAYAKANPGKINMATAGVGSPPHVYGELFKKQGKPIRRSHARPAKSTKKAAGSKAKSAKSKIGKGGSKGDIVVGMLKNRKGASVPAILKATGWQAHSLRAFLSVQSKKQRWKLKRTRDAGVTTYRISG